MLRDLRTGPGAELGRSAGTEIEDRHQRRGDQVRHRLRPGQPRRAQGGVQEEQGRDIDDSLTAEIDGQRRLCRSHGLERVAGHIEHAEREILIAAMAGRAFFMTARGTGVLRNSSVKD